MHETNLTQDLILTIDSKRIAADVSPMNKDVTISVSIKTEAGLNL